MARKSCSPANALIPIVMLAKEILFLQKKPVFTNIILLNHFSKNEISVFHLEDKGPVY